MNIFNRLFAYSPNLKQSWGLAVIFFFCQVGVGFVVGIASTIMRLVGVVTVTENLAQLAIIVIGFALAALIVVYLGKGSNHEPVTPPRQSPLLWILLVPFILSVSLAASPLSSWIPMPDVMKRIFTGLSQHNIPTILTVVVIAPVCEEWLYRGIILKGLLTHYPPLKAIVWSAVIFGVMHANPWQAAPTFCLALAFGWIYWRTRSLRYCIFMHAANNAIASLSTFFSDGAIDGSVTDRISGYHIYAAALLIGALTWVWIKKILSSDFTL